MGGRGGGLTGTGSYPPRRPESGHALHPASTNSGIPHEKRPASLGPGLVPSKRPPPTGSSMQPEKRPAPNGTSGQADKRPAATSESRILPTSNPSVATGSGLPHDQQSVRSTAPSLLRETRSEPVGSSAPKAETKSSLDLSKWNCWDEDESADADGGEDGAADMELDPKEDEKPGGAADPASGKLNSLPADDKPRTASSPQRQPRLTGSGSSIPHGGVGDSIFGRSGHRGDSLPVTSTALSPAAAAAAVAAATAAGAAVAQGKQRTVPLDAPPAKRPHREGLPSSVGVNPPHSSTDPSPPHTTTAANPSPHLNHAGPSASAAAAAATVPAVRNRASSEGCSQPSPHQMQMNEQRHATHTSQQQQAHPLLEPDENITAGSREDSPDGGIGESPESHSVSSPLDEDLPPEAHVVNAAVDKMIKAIENKDTRKMMYEYLEKHGAPGLSLILQIMCKGG